jgi:hypothetical protein
MHARLGRRHRSAWIGVAAFALVLKAAVPLLAALAAQAQGKAVAEICEIYGVRTVAMLARASPQAMAHASPGDRAGHAGHAGHGHDAHAGHETPSHDPVAHGHDREHCALAGLAACAAPAAIALDGPAPALAAAAPLRPPQVAATRPDASASWLAGRIHAPPVTG